MKHKFRNTLLALAAFAMVGGVVAIGAASAQNSPVTAKATTVLGTFTRTAIDDLEEGDEILIVGTVGDNTYAMSNNKGTGNPPSAVSVGVVEDDITNPDSTIVWTYVPADDGHTFYASESTWLYCTNTNNGVRVGTNTNNIFTIDSDSGYLKHEATNRYVGIYNTSNWRCYTSINDNIKNQTFDFFKKEESSGPTVEGITITQAPDKVSYEEGEALDLTGLVVTATWSDQSQSDITAAATFSIEEGTALFPSDTSVKASYGGFDATFNITVKAATFSTEDLYLTGTALGLTPSYSNEDAPYSIGDKDFVFGRTDVLKNKDTGTLQLKANTGIFYNKSKFSAPISKIYFLADADNANPPANWAVYGSADTAGSKTGALEIETYDDTNRIYVVDFSGNGSYFFTVAKTGQYATYFDMIVIELEHSDDDVAAVRNAATQMLGVFGSFCQAGSGPSSENWETIAGYYNDLTTEQKAIFDEAVLNEAPCNEEDPYGAPVQATDLQKAVQKIEYCVSAYGVENFTSREIASSGFVHQLTVKNNSTMLLVAILVVAGIGLAGAMIFFSKKHKKA